MGRRQWIDLQLTRYGAITAGVLPQVPVVVVPPGSQDGWELRNADGSRVSELVIGQFLTETGFVWPSRNRPKAAVRFTVPEGGFTLFGPGFDGELAVQTGWVVEVAGLAAVTRMWAKSGAINASGLQQEYDQVALSLNNSEALAGTAMFYPLLWPSAENASAADFYFGTDDRLVTTELADLSIGDVVTIPGV